jgi:hypothetical protein
MNFNAFRTWTLLSLLVSVMGFSAFAHEVSHTESDKPGWFGGRTQQETTVTQNSDGTTSTETSKQTTK